MSAYSLKEALELAEKLKKFKTHLYTTEERIAHSIDTVIKRVFEIIGELQFALVLATAAEQQQQQQEEEKEEGEEEEAEEEADV